LESNWRYGVALEGLSNAGVELLAYLLPPLWAPGDILVKLEGENFGRGLRPSPGSIQAYTLMGTTAPGSFPYGFESQINPDH